MSLSIWTQCGGLSSARPLRVSPWRVVESQFVSSTRKLVDSEDEQSRLEALIDGVKPPVPAAVAPLGLHYLLSTPFRHPPLRYGSRFGRRSEPGIFYASKEEETCLAEIAYYRFVFLMGTTASLPLIETQLTAFKVSLRAARGVDLTEGSFDRYASRISSKTDYAATQRLGADMRADGVEVALYLSARATLRGTNVAVFAPTAFGARQPVETHEWWCTTDGDKVELRRRSLVTSQGLTFSRSDFLVRGRLPSPAID